MTSIHPERRVGTSVCSWNILYFSVPHKSTTAVTNPHCMSLTDSLSALHHDLQSETPTPAQIQAIYQTWLAAQKQYLASQLAEIQRQGEAEMAQKGAAALAAFEAQQAETLRLAREAVAAASQAAANQASLASSAPSTATPPPTAAVPSISPTPSPEPATPVEVAVPTASPVAPPAATPEPIQAAPSPAAPAASGAKSVNARYAGLKVGLNDRVAFVKHLFNGEDDDFQRVVAALATMESKEECETFLENAVYGDYDWSQKPEIAERFLALVYARFE